MQQTILLLNEATSYGKQDLWLAISCTY